MASEMAVLERWIGGGGEYFAAAEHISPWMTSNKSQLLRVLLDHGASTFSEGGWYDVQVLMINEISSSPQSALHQLCAKVVNRSMVGHNLIALPCLRRIVHLGGC